PAGPQLLEALSVGSLEFGLTGDSPPVFAQAAGKDLVYVGAEPPKPDSSAILVLNDSPLKTLADLKGRKIALQKGSSAHYLLVLAVLFEELTRADAIAQSNRKEAIKLISDFSGLDAGVVSLFIQRRPASPVGPLNAATVADQQRVADAFLKLGLIPRPIRVAEIVWRPEGARLAQLA